ncbi:MAG: AHH domain-containing protein [Nitrospira sp.]|uniref:Uncharacterized protein n=1 Tax=Nitrospira defluvii TaxID=330214 RepID=A0ABN7M2B7_9BACT|nr:AHH domain-containing protein [Nitrospira defluvii]MCS6326167.1 AHH domain-containing protein [Nitrospira sp.]CAE6781648.1 conserved hypothetical protein [Nitrospira defluvii]
MDVGEAVAVDIASALHDESCYFCKSKEPPRIEENELQDSYPDDNDLDGALNDVKFKNDATKLGNALGGKPDALEITVGSGKYTAAVAAHHLIPGNGSLKQSDLFLSEKYLWKDGKEKGNIGYNINAACNGVWLPGNYGVRPWGRDGVIFKAKSGSDPKVFAFDAIEKWGAQFHDAHENYNDFVFDVLNKLYDKLEAQESLWCPEAKKQDKTPAEREPLYVLVSRLNTISSRMSRMLRVPTTNWKRNIYTSRFAFAYIQEKPHLSKKAT